MISDLDRQNIEDTIEGICCKCEPDVKDLLKKVLAAYLAVLEKVKSLEQRINKIENKAKTPRK